MATSLGRSLIRKYWFITGISIFGLTSTCYSWLSHILRYSSRYTWSEPNWMACKPLHFLLFYYIRLPQWNVISIYFQCLLLVVYTFFVWSVVNVFNLSFLLPSLKCSFYPSILSHFIFLPLANFFYFYPLSWEPPSCPNPVVNSLFF